MLLCQYHSIWMTIALKNNIKSGILIPTPPFFLNNSGENGHTCLVPNLKRECSQFFTENNVCCGFIIYRFYYLEDPGIEPEFPALPGGFFTTEPLGKP